MTGTLRVLSVAQFIDAGRAAKVNTSFRQRAVALERLCYLPDSASHVDVIS